MLSQMESAIVARLRAVLPAEVKVTGMPLTPAEFKREFKHAQVTVAFGGTDTHGNAGSTDRAQQDSRHTWFCCIKQRPTVAESPLVLLDIVKAALVGFRPPFTTKKMLHVGDSPPDNVDGVSVLFAAFVSETILVENPTPQDLPLIRRLQFDGENGEQVIVEKP